MWMSDVPDEKRDLFEPVFNSWRLGGHCFVTGLGLAMVQRAMLACSEVSHVTTIERNKDVIKLVGTKLEKDFPGRVTIIEADAMKYKPSKGEQYSVVWHDIWPTLASDNLKEMGVLNRRWTHHATWYGCWGKNICQWMKREEAKPWTGW